LQQVIKELANCQECDHRLRGRKELRSGLELTLQAKVVYIAIVLLLVPVALTTASWHLATMHP
jgi:hypothetical protein